MQIQIAAVVRHTGDNAVAPISQQAAQRSSLGTALLGGFDDHNTQLAKGYGLADSLPEQDKYTGRRDALPEFYEYRDTGCEVSPSCLNCPLERCRYDDFRGITKLRIRERRQRVLELRRQGWGVDRVAKELGVTPRTVYRLSKEGSASCV